MNGRVNLSLDAETEEPLLLLFYKNIIATIFVSLPVHASPRSSSSCAWENRTYNCYIIILLNTLFDGMQSINALARTGEAWWRNIRSSSSSTKEATGWGNAKEMCMAGIRFQRLFLLSPTHRIRRTRRTVGVYKSINLYFISPIDALSLARKGISHD